MHKVFISYSTDDKVWTYELWRAIRDRLNWEVWIDQKLIPATDWWVSICESIKGCDIFIIVLSPKSVLSKYCTAELGYAVALNKPIIPLMLKPCHYPTLLGRRQYEKITDGTPLSDVLLSISNTANKITFDRGQGQYGMPDGVKAPDEPLGDLHELLAQAQAALEVSNFDLAEQFCHKVIQADPDVMGAAAEMLLTQIATARRRQTAYENVRAVLNNPQLAQTAPVAWQRLVERYGAEPDPDGLGERVAKLIVPPPSEPPKPSIKPPVQPKRVQPPAPRFSLPLLEWKPITAGKVSLITENHWRDNYVPKGKPTVFEVGSFEMAKYPITNQQYAAFMKDGGYGERRWWTEAGWQAKQQNQWSEPRYWDNSQFNGLEQPVVGVSWYESVAFCHWLGDKLGERIFLPTEQQWQRAAQGDDGRTYAWGSTWDEARCNHSRKIGQTTPVRQYEGLGDSPFGVVDMTGNVWEWCSTAYDTGSIALEGDAWRVLRGGSWTDSRDGLRAAYRLLNAPVLRSSLNGVRCARSPERSEG